MTDSGDSHVEKRLKIVLVGDTDVGKTSIAVKFCYNEFTRQYTPTAGVDFFLKNLSLGTYKNVNLHLWDVSGLALRGKMLETYVFKANIILFVYDITNLSSFNILIEWMNEIKSYSDNFHGLPLMAIVGNKCDLEHQRAVRRDKSHRFAAENGLPYYDMSARTGESVSLCIANLAAQVLGVRLTRTDQDMHRPIVTAEIGDTVDIAAIKKVIKRPPNKKHNPLLNNNVSSSKSTVCAIQ